MRFSLLLLAAACRSEGQTTFVADADDDGIPAGEDCNDQEAAQGAASTWYPDADGDGFGASTGTTACEQPTGTVGSATDCDDTDATVHPGATELCNGLDDDCDAQVDEDAAAGTFYADADGDGYGTGLGVSSCEQPAGTATEPGDCDDNDAAIHPGAEVACTDADNNCDGIADNVDGDGDRFLGCEECDDTDAASFPGAPEVCDGADNDCDGTIDDDAVDATTWYTDADNDGYGDPATATEGCDPGPGSSEIATDCDDTDAAVHPGADEYCNDRDDDCDGRVDEDALDASTQYIDYDGDGFGSSAYTASTCEGTPGYVDNTDDCDDTDDAVNPDATEVCNGIDDDCDGTTDEDDAAGVTTWYADDDGDGYGDPADAEIDCYAPTGWVADDTDCDDDDARAYPGAPERYDGIDNDCDGAIDDFTWIGTGADGALAVTGETTIGQAWVVTAIDGAVVDLADAATGFGIGDEVLIVNMHGSDGAHANVGAYAFSWVASVSGTEVTLEDALSTTFGEVDHTDLSDQAIQLLRVPQYTDVTVAAGGVLTTPAWDGSTGGVLALRATGTIVVADGGVIDVSALGYWGGETGTDWNEDAYQGESYAGSGDGGLDSSSGAYGNWAAGYYLANYGGGGAMITGGGGNYGGGATAGDSWDGGAYPEAAAGEEYGDEDLDTIFMGSGGAGAWHGSDDPGPGGDGGGIVFLAASAITVEGAGGVVADGETATSWSTGSWTYGSGGGAGGTAWLVADTMTLAPGALSASGGPGESTHTRDGGDGGDGRVRIQYASVNGEARGSGPDATALASACAPGPGSTAAP